MKTAQRLVAMILVLVLLTANGGIVALAEAVLTMPAALQIIDEEAFYGSTSIDRVVLPNKVTEIRSKAFANSTLSEINLPASITYIADDAFDGPDKVSVTATEGTYAYRWAVEHGYISEEIEAIDFTVSPDMLTLTVGSTYTLNASFVPSNATTVSITWGSSKKTVATVNNGTITAKAEGTAIITAIAENGLTATCEVTVVRSIPAPTITSADQDGMGTIVLTWNSLGNGYEYLVYESVDDALVLLGSTINNAYTTHAASAGVHKYCVQACILNDNDILVSSDESAAYDVDVQFIWSFGASIEKIEQTSQNSASITWRGVSPVSYYEIAEVVGNNYTVIANNLTGDTTTISALNQGVHRYAIRSIYNDHDNKTWISSWSTLKAVEMVDFAALQPAAPELLFSDQSSAFSRTESGAPEFEAQRFELSWEQVENAIEYGIRLSYKQGSNWIDIIDDTTKENSFSLNESFFEGLTELTSYRVMLASTGITESSPNVYYFCVYPLQVNTSLLINGVASTAIYHTSATGKTYNFDIESQYNVTATNSADWLIVECDKNSLSITIDDDNSTYVRERNSIVTLYNGYCEATIDVYQWNIDEAPILDNYNFSTVEGDPTEIPYGDISLKIRKKDGETGDGCVIIAELYQLSNNSEWTLISQLVKNGTFSATWNISFENSGIEIGKALKLKLVECGFAEYNSGTPTYKPNLTNEYYFRMIDSGHTITVNGQNNIEISSAEAVTVSVIANCTWSYSTESDWITLGTREGSFPNSANLTITPTKNDTDNTRTAIISLNCGSATSTITFTQLSTKPAVDLPALSTKESSPTTLTAGDESRTFAHFIFRNLKRATFEYKSGSTYVEDQHLGISKLHIESNYYLDYDWSDFTTGVVYRLTVSNGVSNTVYYFKVNSGNTYASIKREDDTSFKDIDNYYANSAGTVLNYTLKSSASWTATTDASWLHLSKTSGSKNTTGITITLTIDPNYTNAIRHGIASFKISNTDRCFIRVEQNPNEYLTLYQCDATGKITNSEINFSSVRGSSGYSYCLLAKTNAASLSYSSDVSWMKATKGDNDTIEISITEANNGYVSRTGHLTVTAGTVSETITVTQVPNINNVNLLSPDQVSTSKTNPGVLQYGNLNIIWEKAAQAVRYGVRITTPENEDIYYDVIDDGNATCSINIPIKKIGDLQEGVYQLKIYAYDAWNYSSILTRYFRFVQGDCIFIGGETAPIWNNVTEYSITSDPYKVMSTGNWTAYSDSSWMTLNRTAGASGDSFTVSLSKNTGNARSGRIVVSCGNVIGYLTVNQCAPIPVFPSLTLPNYSTDKSNPTIIPADTTSITVTWIHEPQASQYEIDLLEYSPKSAGHYVAESGLLRHGEEQYTFNNLSLTIGQLYWVEIKRTNNKITTGTPYYFMLGDENSFVTLNDETVISNEYNAHGRGVCYSVHSSGVWSAISDSNWLTVGKKYIDEDYLIKNGGDAEHHLEHYGQSGDTLYIYIFPNTTASSRTGTITVKSGTASATITFIQEKQYTVASLIEPAALAANPNEDIEIGYGSLHLNWSASNSGTGNYEVLLYESDTGRGGYSRIYRKEGITSRSLTIPQSVFTEGKYYRLWLGSEIEDGDDYENGNYYYFTMGYQNGLAVSAIVDWSQADHGGYVSINAFASGGAGGYEYAYQLLRNGEYEQQAEWGSLTYYQFKPWSNGNYQIRVLAKDSTGKQVSYTSNYTKNDENTISVATANHYTASLDSSYQFLDYSVLSQRSWSVTSYPDWITPSALTGTSSSGNIRLIVAKNDGITRIGKVEFKSDTGIISDLTITQTGSRSVAMVATEETFTNEAQTIEVSFAASDRWSASSDSSWATVSTKSGSSGNRTISVSLAENTGTAERTATVSVISNGDMGQYTIHQLGKTVEQSGLKLSATSWLVSSTAAESKTITITTNGNWSISSIPTWMSANVSSGFGNGDISLYCSGNTEQNARSGIVTISSGSLSQSINITQPGNDVIATVVGFTMSDSTVDAGTMVEFTVITKNADQVQLLVDDIAYNKYDVVDNQVTFTRAFSQGGTRKITIMPIRMGEDGLVSEAKYLTVNSNGTLDKPSFSIAPDNDYVGVAATITIPKVNNADIYTIRVYAPNSALIVDALQVSESELASNNRKIVIDSEKLLLEGVYSVNVIASGNGYSQSEDGNTFTRNARNYSISFSAPNDGAEYVPGDTIYATINQTGGGYASIKVVSPNGAETWYPISDNHTTSDASFTAYIPVEESGTYSIYGYVFAIDLPADHNIVQKEAYITVKAKGPEISRINIAEYGKAYTWIYQNETNLYVTTNNSAEKITVIDRICNEEVSTSNYSLDGWNRLFIVQIPDTSAGAHSILVTATDEDTGKSCTASIDFYIATPISNYTAYASADVSIVSSPINGSKVADILGGAYFEPVTVTHNAGDWLKVKDYLSNSGFIKSTSLSQSVPANASGIITIVSPSANEILPKGTNNTITIRWKSGIAINSQPNLTAVLKNLNSGTNYTLNSSTLFNSKFDVSSVPDGQYSVYLQMKNAAGTIVKSNTVEFILGGYSDEAYYREWFKTNIFPKYSSYLDTVGPYIDGAGMNSIKEAYRFIVGGYVSDGDHWYKILNNEQLSSWITLNETERKQVHLSLVSRLVMDDISRANNILKADLSNVSNVVATVQNNRVVKAKWDTITKAAETTWSGFQTATKAAALVSATSAGVAPEQASDFQDAVERWGERVIEMMKDLITETIEEYNSEALIEAYKQEYAKALKKACKEYVDYLEQTLFGSVGGSQNVNSNQLNERQKAALTYIQGYKRYMNNPVELQNDAVIALLEYCDPNLTIEQLKRDGYTLDEAIKAKFEDPDTYGMLLEHMIDYFVEDLAQYIFERIKPGMAVKEFTGLVRGWVAKAFKWDKTNHAFSVDLDGAKNQIIADAKKYMFTLTFDSFLNMLCQINVDNIACNQQMINQVLHNGSFSGEIDKHYKEVKTGIAKAAFSLCKSAWKTGNRIAGLIGAAYSWDSESQGRGAFEMYSVYLADAYKYHLTYTSGAMALPYDWNYLSNQSISRLEQLRGALIILMNNDVDALTYYRAMRTINENAGWRFHLVLRDGNGNETDRYDRSDYASLGLIDAQINAFNEIKQKVMDVPTDIQIIINKYK